MQVSIDPHSGFCFGVQHAIGAAERELLQNPVLYCLGDIVHNSMEVNRLKQMGLVIITFDEFKQLHDCKVLIRAHGEPPETYRTAILNNIELVDASCPIVLDLQSSVHQGYLEMKQKNGQIVIYGMEGHAEVNALIGQTNGTAIVIGSLDELDKIDFSRPVRCYSQTTKGVEGFRRIVNEISSRMKHASGDHPVDFEWNDSICRQVSNRSAQLSEFAGRFDLIIFVGGLHSSNGMVLFEVCREVNPVTHLVTSLADVDPLWFKGIQTVGVCGATSTPGWLMQEIADGINKIGN